jgi:hypothetical protein
MFSRRALAAIVLSSTVFAAEPRPPSATRYVDLTLRWARGKISVEKVEAGRFDSPTVMKRFSGRFEARVTAGGKPVDSVRFDFPLLADADPGVMGDMNEKMKAGATSVAKVRVPLTDGADALALYDLREEKPQPIKVPLPPDAPAGARPPPK